MIYVMSDIHGMKHKFNSIMNQIKLQPDDTLYILGDVIDRNPYGIDILKEIMDMPNVQFLLGNHEIMMLMAVLEDDERYQEYLIEQWYKNGGEVTYNKLMECTDEEIEKIFKYLRSSPLEAEVEIGDKKFLLCHAAPMSMYKPSKAFPDEIQFAVWYRYKKTDKAPDGYTIICGHTPTFNLQPEVNPVEIHKQNGWINIDCGCAYPLMKKYGIKTRLACIRLDDMKVFYSN